MLSCAENPPTINSEVFSMVRLKNGAMRSKSGTAVYAVMGFLILIMSPAVFGGSFWEGTIATANYGVFPDPGMYGASNAFPLNTSVVVTNPDNGKTVEVVITKRLEDSPVFIALSPEAGKKIGLSSGNVVSGTIALKSSIIEEVPDLADRVSTPDPESTPGGDQSEELALIKNYIDEELGGENQSAVVPSGKVEPVLPVPGNTEAAVPRSEETATSEPAEPESVKNTALADSGGSGGADEDVPVAAVMPPDNPGTVGPAEAAVVQELPVPDIAAAETKDDIPSVLALNVAAPDPGDGRKSFRADDLPLLTEDEKDTPEVVGLIASAGDNRFVPPELAVPSIKKDALESGDDKPVMVSPDMTSGGKESSFVPGIIASPEIKDNVPEDKHKPVPPDAELVLNPASPKPPEPSVLPAEKKETASSSVPVSSGADIADASSKPAAAPVTEAVNRPAVEVGSGPVYTVTKKLKDGAYYLQLGAYSEEYAARGFADTLAGKFPVTVYVSKEKDKADYKVMVGPLKEDEGGALLFNFKAMGYKDAFLRKGK